METETIRMASGTPREACSRVGWWMSTSVPGDAIEPDLIDDSCCHASHCFAAPNISLIGGSDVWRILAVALQGLVSGTGAQEVGRVSLTWLQQVK
ncbi:hypothetical protein CEXT_375601 [Caerostris extrusa]|uniref:Uncharacterized protein n=1 Tax=Caerostris extrusa TaxID=172846 RepID=A0AAV4U324_CAEEX|nr:hypothetical protein CEXT_375601 [Caerostris extrusa]